MAMVPYLLGNQILGIYSSDPEVIAYGLERLSIICTMYCLCGIMDVLVGSIRGLGYAVMPMIVSLMGVCVSCGLYLYDISVEQNLTDAVYFLSHYLDVDGSRSCNLFCDCAKEDRDAEIMAVQGH